MTLIEVTDLFGRSHIVNLASVVVSFQDRPHACFLRIAPPGWAGNLVTASEWDGCIWLRDDSARNLWQQLRTLTKSKF